MMSDWGAGSVRYRKPTVRDRYKAWRNGLKYVHVNARLERRVQTADASLTVQERIHGKWVTLVPYPVEPGVTYHYHMIWERWKLQRRNGDTPYAPPGRPESLAPLGSES